MTHSRDDARPLILVTNDDGFQSWGLRAAVRAVWGLGNVVVAVPRVQQSAVGRSLPNTILEVTETTLQVGEAEVSALTLQGTPAQAVQYALNHWCPHRPALLVSGINHGENLGSDITASGTVGAAIEGACAGIPALAASLETDPRHHHGDGHGLDFTVAVAFTRWFAAHVLACGLPAGVDILKIDVPADATLDTPWQLARASRQYYWVPGDLRPDPADPTRLKVSYHRSPQRFQSEPDSDIATLAVRRHVAVVPLAIDLTAQDGWMELTEDLGLQSIGEPEVLDSGVTAPEK
jgi:5'-nucleotidase